jgi:hypothetical protein
MHIRDLWLAITSVCAVFRLSEARPRFGAVRQSPLSSGPYRDRLLRTAVFRHVQRQREYNLPANARRLPPLPLLLLLPRFECTIHGQACDQWPSGALWARFIGSGLWTRYRRRPYVSPSGWLAASRSDENPSIAR